MLGHRELTMQDVEAAILADSGIRDPFSGNWFWHQPCLASPIHIADAGDHRAAKGS